MSQWARENPEEARLRARREDLAMEVFYEDRDNPKEECCRCFDATGRVPGKDGLFKSDDSGPYCEDCFNLDPLIEAVEQARKNEVNVNQAENIP